MPFHLSANEKPVDVALRAEFAALLEFSVTAVDKEVEPKRSAEVRLSL
jgi:hypothetical protein